MRTQPQTPYETSSIKLLVNFINEVLNATNDEHVHTLLHEYEYGYEIATTVTRRKDVAVGVPSRRVLVKMYEYSWQHGTKQLAEDIPWFKTAHDERCIRIARMVERFCHTPWITEDKDAAA